MFVCVRCKKELGKSHISFQDVESGVVRRYHDSCAKVVQEIVVNEYINLMCRVANYTLERRVK